MNKIRIKDLHLVNFKGIQSLDMYFFMEGENFIGGANGSGKTTVFDAFTWLLFGKDSHDRKDFSIKTYDKDGNAIPNLPHEVYATIDVNGEEITLRKSYKEIWARDRATQVEYIRSHQTDCFYNNVPLSVSEYSEKINELLSEETFKLITNPFYFTSQRQDVQRKFLFSLAGEIDNNEIAEDNASFCEVVNMISGKTIDELNREIAANKRRIKEEISTIPIRINEQQRNMIEERDWTEIENRISTIRKEMAALQDANEGIRKKNEDSLRTKQELYNRISAINNEISSIKLEIEKEAMKEYNEQAIEIERKKNVIRSLDARKNFLLTSINKEEQDLAILQKELEALREEYAKITSQKLDIDEKEFACPTCGRLFDSDKIEEIEVRLNEEFNKRKAGLIEDNVQKGKEATLKIDSIKSKIDANKSEIFEIDSKIAEIGEVEDMVTAKPDVKALFDSDERIKSKLYEISRLRQQIDSVASCYESSSNMAAIAEKQAEIEKLTAILSTREQKKAQEGRIAELMQQQSDLAAKLSDIERIEMKVLEFNKERVHFIESKINGLFQIVRFKLFDTLLNGNTVECCEATVDGVPFSASSNSEKINIGLDIINAICIKNNISAPIFIDNRESVSKLISIIDPQIISLSVDENCAVPTILHQNIY